MPHHQRIENNIIDDKNAADDRNDPECKRIQQADQNHECDLDDAENEVAKLDVDPLGICLLITGDMRTDIPLGEFLQEALLTDDLVSRLFLVVAEQNAIDHIAQSRIVDQRENDGNECQQERSSIEIHSRIPPKIKFTFCKRIAPYPLQSK